MWSKGGKRIGGHPGPGIRNPSQKRGFPGIGEADQPDVGDEFQFHADGSLLALVAVFELSREKNLLAENYMDDPLIGASEFRARLLTVRGAPAEPLAEEVTVAVASPGDVLDAVRDWLDGFVRQATHPD